MSVTKDSTFDAMAAEKYRVAFQRAQWAFSVDQLLLFFFLSSLFHHCTVSMIFVINK